MLKLILKAVFSIFAGFLLFMISLVVLFQIQPARETLTKAILDTIEIKTGWTIDVGHYEGILPFQLEMESLRIAKEGQPYLEMDHLKAAVSPIDLFHGTVAFTNFELDGFRTFESFQASGEEGPSLILPIRKITFRKMRLSGLNLHGLSDELTPLEIKGSATLYPLKSYITTKLIVDRKDNSCPPLCLSASLHRKDWILSFEEEAGGLVHELYEIDIPLPLKLTASGSANSPLIDLQMSTDLSDLKIPSIRGVGKHILLEGRLEVKADSTISINEFEGQFLDGDLTFDGSLTYEASSRFIDGTINLAPFSFQEYGKFTISLLFRGPIDSPTLTLNCFSPLAEAGGLKFSQLHSQTVCEYRNGGWEGEWIAQGRLEDLPLTLSFNSFLKQNEEVKISKFVMTCPSATLFGHLAVDPRNLSVQGKLDGTIQQLEVIGDLLGVPLYGSGGLAITLEPDQLKATLQGKDIAFYDVASEKISVDLSFKQLWGNYQGQIALNSYHHTWKDNNWNEFSFGTAVTRDKKTWPFTLTATGVKNDETDLNASGKWHLDRRDFFVHLGVFSGHVYSIPYELKAPVNIYAMEDEVRTSVVTLSLGEGDVRGEAMVSSGDVNCMFDLKNLPASLFNHLLPDTYALNGEVSCFLRLTGPPDDIQGSLGIKGKDLHLYDRFFAEFPVCQGKIEAVLSDNLFTFEGEIYDSPNPMTIEGEIPIALSLYPLHWEFPPEDRMRTEIRTSGEIGPFLELLAIDTTNMGGFAEMEVIVGGKPSQPIVEGFASLKNGSFESLTTGAVLRDIELTLMGNDKKLILQNFTASDGREGKVTATGNILLDQNLPFEFDITASRAALLYLDLAAMTMSGSIKFSGDRSQGRIEGDLLVDDAELEIPEKLPVQMKTVEVTFINEEAPLEAPPEKKSKDPWPTALALNFHVPSNAFVTGKNFESEWMGDFSVSGTLLETLYNGTLQIIEGQYSFNDEKFISTQGSVNFAGELGSKTTIYIVGEHQGGAMKIQAILKGAIDDPTLTFRSNPPMSQKEILAWILFGHSIEEITPFQVARLSRSVFSLSSNSEDPDIITQLRNKMGIDRIDLSTGDSEGFNELSVRLGKYISQGIYVSLNKSINAEVNQIAIEAKLTPHFKVQAEIGDNAEGKMNLKWAKDY